MNIQESFLYKFDIFFRNSSIKKNYSYMITFDLLKEVYEVKGLPQQISQRVLDICRKMEGTLSDMKETSTDRYTATVILPAGKLPEFQSAIIELFGKATLVLEA